MDFIHLASSCPSFTEPKRPSVLSFQANIVIEDATSALITSLPQLEGWEAFDRFFRPNPEQTSQSFLVLSQVFSIRQTLCAAHPYRSKDSNISKPKSSLRPHF